MKTHIDICVEANTRELDTSEKQTVEKTKKKDTN